jgi:O-antigen/teichoic acid export membrane protein
MSSAGQGIGRVLGYATQVALARFFGPAQLGFYAIGVTMVQLANILSQFGMDNGVVRYVAHYRAEGDHARVRGTVLLVLGVAFALSVVLSVLLFAGAGLLAEGVFGKPFLESTFRAFSLAVPFFTLMSTALFATQGFQTVKYATYVEHVLRPLINLALVVVFYLLGVQILGAVAAYAVSMALGSVLALYYLSRLLPGLAKAPAKFEAREVLGASGPMMVAKVTGYANSWAMVWVLGIFASAREVGIYNAASRTAALCGLVLLAFSGIFSPMISRLYRRSSLDHLGRLYEDVSRWTFTGSLAIFLPTALLARDILAVFGTDFVAGWLAMVVIAAGYLFGSSVGLTARVLVMTGHEKRVMWAKVATTVVTIAAGAAMAPVFGIMGAAVATATGLFLVNALTVFFVRRLLGSWPFNWLYLKPLAAGLLAAGGASLSRWALPLPDGLPTILVIGPIFLALFAVLTVALGLGDSDRQFLLAFWSAVRRNTGIGRSGA